MWYLLLCEVGAGYFNESAPGAFDETFGALYFGGGCNDLVLGVVDPSEALAPHEFLVEVGVELAGVADYVYLELVQGVDDLV